MNTSAEKQLTAKKCRFLISQCDDYISAKNRSQK
jgi:hypothetical protein